MKSKPTIGERIPRSYIGSTEDTKHLTNEERHMLRAEEKRLAALKREEVRKRKELEQIEAERLLVEKRMQHKAEQAKNPELISRYKKSRNRKRMYSFLKWSAIALGCAAGIALIIWLISEFLWLLLAIIVLPSWLLAALKDGAKV